jgi:N-ethylmaleimide reductase
MSNLQQPLLTGYEAGDLTLKNRIVMASLTRGRATNIDLAPTALHALYYAQRASAGLIITEGTWVSPKAIGFINVPGIYSEAQIKGWKLVTDAVHEKGGKIFIQLAHSGAASHPDFFDGALPLGPSAINPQISTFTPNGVKESVTPNAFTIEEIKQTVLEFRQAAQNAKEAGFDGVELHAQIFTLIPQFLSIKTNQRTDEYGGTIENRARLLFEILDVLKEVWPGNRIGIKFTPTAFNPGVLVPDEHTIPTYDYILGKLNDYDLGYLHLVGPATELTGTIIAALNENYFEHFRKIYKGTLMANGGFTQQTGNRIIADGVADIVSYGAAFIANPDLPVRFAHNVSLSEADNSTYYTGGEKGYADYPATIL